jgi:hypothetical protein
MDYGFWLAAAAPIGHTPDFRGRFDVVMSFFFYLPNLALAELFIRDASLQSNRAFRIFAGILLNIATLFVIIGTYSIVHDYWGPAILRFLQGRS